MDERCKPDTPQFGRVPYDLIVSGRLAASGADRVELLILFAIAAHANESFRGYAAMETLAQHGGVTERSARRAIRRLEGRRIITVTAGGGRGRTNRYTINADAQSVPVCIDKPGRLDTETQTPASRNPDAKGLKPGRTERPPNRGIDRTEQQSGGTAGAVASKEQIAEALDKHGLAATRPLCDALAGVPVDDLANVIEAALTAGKVRAQAPKGVKANAITTGAAEAHAAMIRRREAVSNVQPINPMTAIASAGQAHLSAIQGAKNDAERQPMIQAGRAWIKRQPKSVRTDPAVASIVKGIEDYI